MLFEVHQKVVAFQAEDQCEMLVTGKVRAKGNGRFIFHGGSGARRPRKRQLRQKVFGNDGGDGSESSSSSSSSPTSSPSSPSTFSPSPSAGQPAEVDRAVLDVVRDTSGSSHDEEEQMAPAAGSSGHGGLAPAFATR